MSDKKYDGLKDTAQTGNTKGRKPSVLSRSIRRHREALGMEQKELAKRLEIPASAVSNWETGFSKPNLDVLIPICKVLDMTLYELFETASPEASLSRSEKLLIEEYRMLSPGHREAVKNMIHDLGKAELMDHSPVLTVLTYFDRQLAAGIGDPTELDDKGQPIYLHPSELVDSADFVFTVNGNSMEPEYHSGDMVLVKRFPECGDITSGEVGAFVIGNEAYIKEYQPDGLHSYNKRFKTMTFVEDDTVSFIGKVTGTLDSSDIATNSEIERFLASRAE